MKDKTTVKNTSSTLRHDLRNALTPAMMSADMLKNHPDAKVQRHAQNILNALEKALQLLQTKPTESQ